MTLKEFITGSVKILGFVILLYGFVTAGSAVLAAGGIYYSKQVMKDMPATSSDAEFEAQLQRTMRASEMKSKSDLQLMRIPYALLQIGFGLYLCRREQRIVHFLLKP